MRLKMGFCNKKLHSSLLERLESEEKDIKSSEHLKLKRNNIKSPNMDLFNRCLISMDYDNVS